MMNLSRIGDLGLVYDGVPLSDHFIVNKVSMPLMPNFDASTLYIDGKPGAWFAGRKVGTRDIRVNLGMLSDTKKRVDALDNWLAVSDILAKDKICKLELGNGLYVNAIVMDDSQMTRKGKWSTADITFRCYDPYIYGEEHTVEFSSGNFVVNIEGKQPVWPVYKLTGHSSSYGNTLINNNTGQRVKVNSLTSTTELIVDMEAHRCTVNGAYKPVDPSVSDFWPLKPGSNSLYLSYGSGSFTYRETYL